MSDEVLNEAGRNVAAVRLPGFFDAVPAIVVVDPLAALLGAAEGGHLEYRYADAVRLAGHSCPTVAGAWLMTRKALAHLYLADLPQRGGLQVALRQPLEEGVAGVVGSVAGLVTGAAGDGGFKGLAGRHARRDLLRFGVPMAGELRVTRLDTGAAVELVHHAQAVPRPPGLTELMREALAPQAGHAAREAFGAAWQGWVRTMLIDHADDPALIAVVA